LVNLLFYIILLLLIGLLVGFIGAMLGVGGGFILVPLLTFLFDFETHYAIGTSLATIAFTGSSSTLAYSRQRRLDWKLGLLVEVAAMPGALIGSFLTSLFSSKQLKIFLALLLISLSLSILARKEAFKPRRATRSNEAFLWKRVITDFRGGKFEYEINVLRLLPLGLLAGIASGFFGIGGGVITVPLLYHMGTPIHIAIATSTLIVMLTSLSGAVGHAILGHVSLLELMGIVPGVLIGTQIGALTARKIKSEALKRIFAFVLIIMAILLLIKSD